MEKPFTTIMLDFTASVLLALLVSQIAYPQGLVHLVAWLAIFFSYYFFAVSMAGALRVNQVVFTGTETKILRITFLIPCFGVYYIFYQGVGGLITSVFLTPTLTLIAIRIFCLRRFFSWDYDEYKNTSISRPLKKYFRALDNDG